MNKIKVLIDNGFITDNDIREYISSNQDFYGNDEPEYPDYDEAYNQYINELEYDEMIANELNRQEYINPEYNTEYIIASTNVFMQETMVFPSNEEGEITDYGDLVCLSLRNGHEDWADPMSAVITLNTDEYVYTHVKTKYGGNNIHNLFKRINVKDNIVI